MLNVYKEQALTDFVVNISKNKLAMLYFLCYERAYEKMTNDA